MRYLMLVSAQEKPAFDVLVRTAMPEIGELCQVGVSRDGSLPPTHYWCGVDHEDTDKVVATCDHLLTFKAWKWDIEDVEFGLRTLKSEGLTAITDKGEGL